MFRYNPLTPTKAAGTDAPVQLSFSITAGSDQAELEPAPETAHVIAAAGTPPDAKATIGDATVHEPGIDGSPTESELLAWFGDDTSPVLRFAHLYKVNPRFTEQSAQAGFDTVWSSACEVHAQAVQVAGPFLRVEPS
jgi:hypothetical protein